MPTENIEGSCHNCKAKISAMVHWTTGEEVSAGFQKYLARGFFIFGLTLMVFVWGLTLMCKEYDLQKLTKLLANPEIQVEETTYSDVRKDVNADVFKVIRAARPPEVKAGK